MISYLPMTKASVGLSITRDSLCLVEVRRSWNRVTCRHISETLLPASCLRLSPARPNIENMKEFVRSLSTLVKHCTLPQSVVLSLPDICGRTTILPFPSFPAKQSEQDSVVRWRFQQDMNIATDKTRFAYRMFSASKDQTSPRQVLATAVQHDVIEQYEEACLEVGLLPNSVGLSGLDVCDFYQSTMPEFNRPTKRPSETTNQEYLFLYLANWGFSFMAFRHSIPIFLRVKALPIPRFTQDHEGPDQRETGHTADPAVSNEDPTMSNQQRQEQYSALHLNSVSNELVATLQYYFESHQHIRSDHAPIPLYFAEGVLNGEALLPSEHTIENMLNATILRPPPLSIMKVADTLSPKTKVAMMQSSPQMTGFSALASVAIL
ncbi:MAG: hypothetical protein NPIRA05_07960 [Nitrospirales bacterium]|nr:MAG: hypothetical protein NPIRA05_07960 [Nitrospirales bacterium]